MYHLSYVLTCLFALIGWGDAWGEDGYYRLEKGVDKCGVSNMVVHSVFKGHDN